MIHYKLHYTEESQLFPNFGTGNWIVPLVVDREYRLEYFDREEDIDTHVMNLSDPQATKIEKRIGETGEWKQIYPKT